eukprot:CAMPEP_0117443072 /NCGR_PEP_ID=MMETSP0759-20121206/4497_1 /TAXON_ID=63605 /ORGANISM="Percolomonas cosmopolitus, Strain WS" /LENGTH=510 /DNA_ID=CAMNT_0005235017 /DNA_START=246 /DNA_END=1778 /DNA_ORIENTATION=+
MSNPSTAESSAPLPPVGDSTWLFDSIIGFLKSPMWVNPIQSFIDEYCVIFDTEDENKFSFSQLHEEFRELIDSLLHEHLADLGVSEEQFVQCVENGNNPELKKVVSEYLLAMDDFVTFKQMMEKRNIQLEYQALQALKRQREAESEALSNMSEEDLVKMAIAKSIKEQEMRDRQREIEEAELKQAIAMSLACHETPPQQSHQPEDKSSEPAPQPQTESTSDDATDNTTTHESPHVEASTPPEPKQIEQPAPTEDTASTASSTASSTTNIDPERKKQFIKDIENERKQISSQNLDPEQERVKKLELEKFKQMQEARKRQAESDYLLKKKSAAPLTSERPVQDSPLKPLNRPLLTKKETSNNDKLKLDFIKKERENLLRKNQLERENQMNAYKKELEKKKQEARVEISNSAQSQGGQDSQLSQMEQRRLAMRMALAKKLKEDLLNESTVKSLQKASTETSVEEMSERLRQAEEERRRREEEKSLGLESKFANVALSGESSQQDEDSFSFAEK